MAQPLIHQLEAGEIAAAVGGSVARGPSHAHASGVSIDSRTIRPGELFVAIRGPRTDGHAYLGEVMAKGAAGALVDSRYEAPAELPEGWLLIQAPDTHVALKDLASEIRRRWRGSLVAVTGSMGKTTTKEFLGDVLASEFSVYRSPGNYNNLFGLPLAVLGLSTDDHLGVFEMGMSARGEIAEMCRIARPDAGVITNVAPVHLEGLGSLEEVAAAKGELAASLAPSGTFVYNADDPLVREIAGRTECTKISFGTSEEAAVRAQDIEVAGPGETRFRVTAFGEARRASLPMAGRHYVLDALPAIALGRHYRIPLLEILESLQLVHQAPMRGQVRRFKPGFTLIDDSYNSNPRALAEMISTLAGFRSFRRRVAVTGEMRELGPESGNLHYECGQQIARAGIDRLVAVGPGAAELARGAREAGMAEAAVTTLPDADAAAELVSSEVREGDVVLVKGSRGVALERVIAAVQARFEEED